MVGIWKFKRTLSLVLVIIQFLMAAVVVSLAAVSLANRKSYVTTPHGKPQHIAARYYPYTNDKTPTAWDAQVNNYISIGFGSVNLIFDAFILFIIIRQPKREVTKVKANVGLFILGWIVLIAYQAYFYCDVNNDGPSLGDALDVCKLDGPQLSNSKNNMSAPHKRLHHECAIFLIEFVKFVFIIACAVSMMAVSSQVFVLYRFKLPVTEEELEAQQRRQHILLATMAYQNNSNAAQNQALINAQNAQANSQMQANIQAQSQMSTYQAQMQAPQPYFGGYGA